MPNHASTMTTNLLWQCWHFLQTIPWMGQTSSPHPLNTPVLLGHYTCWSAEPIQCNKVLRIVGHQGSLSGKKDVPSRNVAREEGVDLLNHYCWLKQRSKIPSPLVLLWSCAGFRLVNRKGWVLCRCRDCVDLMKWSLDPGRPIQRWCGTDCFG